jgi:2-polyprenyl-3-methyl-5-hydroxy-6-metoxy-1,4-benzoquinol methylase
VSHRDCGVCGSGDPDFLFRKDGHDIVACRHCGLVYVGEDPAAIDFAALYGPSYYAGGSDAVFSDYVGQQAARCAHARRKLWWLRHVPPRIARSGRLLDVGCAAGFFLAEARRFYEVQGVELSAWSSAYARDRLGLPVFTGTLQDAGLPADRFDVVTLWDVIEHVPGPVPLLAEAARVLRPGGRLVLTTGDWGSAYAQARREHWHLMTPPWHLTMFSRDTLARAAAGAGLEVVACRSEGVAGDGRLWRNRAMLLVSRALGRGDIMRMTLTK